MVKARSAAFGVGPVEAVLHPGAIHLQGGEQLPQLIVQFPGQQGALIFLIGHDAAGEALQLLLGLFDGGDVGRDAAEAADRAEFIVQRKFHRQIGAHPVSVIDLLLHLAGAFLRQDLLIMGPQLVGDFLGEQLMIGFAFDFLQPEAEQFFKTGIDQQIMALGILEENHGRGVLEDAGDLPGPLAHLALQVLGVAAQLLLGRA